MSDQDSGPASSPPPPAFAGAPAAPAASAGSAGGAPTDGAAAVAQSETADRHRTRASRIMAAGGLSIYGAIAVLDILVGITTDLVASFVPFSTPTWSLVFRASVQVLLMLVVLAGSLVVYVHAYNREILPSLLRPFFNLLATRFEERPAELGMVIGIAVVVAFKNICFHHPELRELLAVLLMLAAMAVLRPAKAAKAQFARREENSWQRLFRTGQTSMSNVTVVTATPATAQPMSPEPADQAELDASRQRWEARQHERWEDWMQEEVGRIDDEHDKD